MAISGEGNATARFVMSDADKALNVIAKTPHIRKYLQEHDPQALRQVDKVVAVGARRRSTIVEAHVAYMDRSTPSGWLYFVHDGKKVGYGQMGISPEDLGIPFINGSRYLVTIEEVEPSDNDSPMRNSWLDQDLQDYIKARPEFKGDKAGIEEHIKKARLRVTHDKARVKSEQRYLASLRKALKKS